MTEVNSILGSWQLKYFEIKGIKTYATDRKTFLFRKKGTYEEVYYSNNLLIKAQIAKTWKEEKDGIKLYNNDKVIWQVIEHIPNGLCLQNMTNNIIYYLERN